MVMSSTEIYYDFQYGGVLIENLWVENQNTILILRWVWDLDYNKEIEEKFAEYF